MNIIKNVSTMKAKLHTEAKALLVKEMDEAVKEMKLIRSGKVKTRDAEDFLNKL